MTTGTELVEWHREVPRSIRSHAAVGLALFALAFGGFGTWGATAPLASAVIAPGSFMATGRNTIVQHLEGGQIAEILVEEGQRVAAGEVIVRLDRTAARADLREYDLRQARLEATEARLQATLSGETEVSFPPALEARAQESPEVRQILSDQRSAFTSARALHRSELSILENNVGALEVRSEGYRLQRDAYRERGVLLSEELESKRTLYDSGHIRLPELNAVRRAVLETEGHIARLDAEIEEIAHARSKLVLEIAKLKSERRTDALNELTSVQAELDSVREKARKAADILERADIAAPVAGTVVRLHYHGRGGVIEAGKPVAEILPADAPLLIETLLPRTDIDAVHMGQAANIRLTALNARTTPVLDGRVSYVSADAVTHQDEGTAPREVYVAHVNVPPEELDRLNRAAPVPGMPAEVMIRIEERTFFDYLVKPIRDSMARAFREE
ncbi:HlyD family type I secretion periplasmic adaptor subunit [Rhodosalinus sediminis]|uniref:HlyD family type I secretion periplasmic adaptor subunit n=1 Tax=Rhodosalinus sediminis TaxID=1940533 RepID=UPI002353B835|nr:HlyD family type I secretion periplasmic adaptor subunit [Rhodosalinus sediminis]